ncbi:MAG: hypothetical protein AAF333_17340 [Planctomycetota bacterium]
MYELTCPSCQKARRSPFVRVTAVTRCPHCGHVWRVSESHFVRRQPPVPSPAVVTPEPELKHDDPPADDPKGGSSVTGLSGLSDIMQAEPAKLSSKVTGPGPAPLQQAKLASPPPPRTVPTRPDPALTRQPRRTAILVIAALAAFIAIAGIALVVLFGGGGDADHATSDPAPARDAAGDDPADPADLLPQGPPRPGATPDQ